VALRSELRVEDDSTELGSEAGVFVGDHFYLEEVSKQALLQVHLSPLGLVLQQVKRLLEIPLQQIRSESWVGGAEEGVVLLGKEKHYFGRVAEPVLQTQLENLVESGSQQNRAASQSEVEFVGVGVGESGPQLLLFNIRASQLGKSVEGRRK
jgi:hypothetical protein